jgi:hypothetical protein
MEIFKSLMPQQMGANRRKNRSIQVKEKAGLKYREISDIVIFGDLSFSSLRRLNRISKEKLRKERTKVEDINQRAAKIFDHFHAPSPRSKNSRWI